MEPIWEQLRNLRGRICLLCLGNDEGGDDALGVRLGQALIDDGIADVEIAGTEPERSLARGIGKGYDHVIFIDAVDFGASPGSVVFLGSADISARFAQVSTHRLSLGLLGRWIESNGSTKAWLLGVQPESITPLRTLSRSVEMTLATLKELLSRRLNEGVNAC